MDTIINEPLPYLKATYQALSEEGKSDFIDKILDDFVRKPTIKTGFIAAFFHIGIQGLIYYGQTRAGLPIRTNDSNKAFVFNTIDELQIVISTAQHFKRRRILITQIFEPLFNGKS